MSKREAVLAIQKILDGFDGPERFRIMQAVDALLRLDTSEAPSSVRRQGPEPKLQPSQVISMRRRYNAGEVKMKDLMAETRLSHTAIWSMLRGKTYKYIKEGLREK